MERVSRINLSVVDSTNRFVHEMLGSDGDGTKGTESLPGFTLVVAERQTKGRGQQGNAWESEAGQNLTFSLLCHPDFVPPARQFVLSECMALALWKVLSDIVEGVTVKWPNDLYVGDKKVSGTLIECDLMGKSIANCIIGVGLNVHQTVFRSDAPNPTSLKLLTGRDFDREQLLSDVVANFQSFYEMLHEGRETDIHQLYISHLYRREGLHHYCDVRGDFWAEIADVEPTGHLRLRFENGQIVRYELKEVRFVLDEN